MSTSGPAPSAAEDLAASTRMLARRGLLTMFGHVSVLDDQPGRYLVCPGAGSRKDRCSAQDIIHLDFDEDWRPGLPLELYMHSEAHRLNPRIGSLVHVHSPALVQLSTLTEVPSDVLVLHAGFWPDPVPVFDEPDLVRDRDDAHRLTATLGDASLALMRWHGAIVAGPTLREATIRAILAEEHAAVLLGALASGRPVTSYPGDRRELYERMVPQRLIDMYWAYERSFVEDRA